MKIGVSMWRRAAAGGMVFGAAFGMAVASQAAYPADGERGVARGVVVREVAAGDAAASAGVAVGDVLERWQDTTGSGVFDSTFDVSAVEIEHGARQEVRLTGSRCEEKLVFALSPGRWGLEVAPLMHGEVGAAYERGSRLIAEDDTEPGMAALRQAAEEAGRDGDALLACWLHLERATALVEARTWDRLDAVFDLALAEAEAAARSDVAAGVWEARARAAGKQGATERAVEAYQRALELRDGESASSLAAASTREALGRVAFHRGDLDGAEKWYRGAFEMREERAPGTLFEAESLVDLGTVARKRGNLDGAHALLTRALRIQERVDPRGVDVARTLGHLAIVAWERGDLATAEETLHDSLEIVREREPGGAAEARAVNTLGVLAFTRGDLDAAAGFFEQSLSLFEGLAPGGRDIAKALNNLGIIAAARADLETAETYYRRSLAIKQELAPGSLDVAGGLDNLGVLVRHRGDLAAAEEFHRRALAIRRRLAPASLSLAGNLGNLGVVARQRGDLVGAEACYREALAIVEERAPGSLDVAIVLTNIGNLALERSDLTAAEEAHLQSLEIRERHAPGSADVAQSLTNLGVVAREREELASSEVYLHRALAIHDKLAPGGEAAAATLDVLGRIALDHGDLDGAERSIRRALANRETRSPGSLPVADSLDSLATVLEARGKVGEAQKTHDKALQIRTRLAPGSALEAGSLHAIGVLLIEQGQREPALGYLQRAVDALESQKARLGGGDEAAERFSERYADYYHDLVELQVLLKRVEDAFDTLERYRARTLLEMLVARDLDMAGDAAAGLLAEYRAIEVAAAAVEAEVFSLSPVQEAERLDEALDRLRTMRQRRGELLAELRRSSPELAELVAPTPLDVDGARRVLDPGTLLLTYSTGAESTELFALLDGRLEHHSIPMSRAELHRMVRAFRLLAAAPVSRRSRLDQRARELHDALISPVSTLLEEAERVLVCPDGPLHMLPFAALQTGDGSYVVEHKPLFYTASASVYSHLTGSRRKVHTRRLVAAFADPQLPSARGGVTASATLRSLLGGTDLTALPSTRSELGALLELFGEQTTSFVGADATEETAKALGRDLSLVHFGCHGFLDERSPLDSGLVLSIPATGAEGGQDGVLQAWEVLEEVRLDADLVTLSGCETGKGTVRGGEGLIGLTRAFQFAGSRAVLASLWTVGDESTAVLMQRFYHHLKTGLPMAYALRQAQLELVRGPVETDVDGDSVTLDLSHPFRWAAFQLHGDWR